MRRSGKIRDTKLITGQPVATFHQPTNIFEVIFDVLRARLDASAIGISGLHQTFVYTLIDKIDRHFAVKLAVEPTGKSTRLSPINAVRWQQKRRWSGFFEIFANRSTVRDGLAILVDKNWHFARRIKAKKVDATVPWQFFDQLGLNPFFAQNKTDLAGKRGQGQVKKSAHSSDQRLGVVRS